MWTRKVRVYHPVERDIMEPEIPRIFPCEQCGACCRAMKCELLVDGNVCGITPFSDRPVLCNVRESFEQFFHKVYTWDEYVNHNKECCLLLRRLELWKEEK